MESQSVSMDKVRLSTGRLKETFRNYVSQNQEGGQAEKKRNDAPLDFLKETGYYFH